MDFSYAKEHLERLSHDRQRLQLAARAYLSAHYDRLPAIRPDMSESERAIRQLVAGSLESIVVEARKVPIDWRYFALVHYRERI